VEKLPLQSINFAKLLVEGEVAVLVVHDDRMAELSEVEEDLVHASGRICSIYLRGIYSSEEVKDMRGKKSVVHSDPKILGGIPVFVGTRVPVKNLIDYLEAGDSLDDFLQAFPAVSREQAIAALEIAKEALAADAHSAG
jgi:uncharacterized protein (DUF433 family)